MTVSSANTIPINPTPEQHPQSAAEHMDRLQGELVTPDFAAGWAQKNREGYEHNEDAVYAFYDPTTQNGVFAVMDGVGGNAYGELASMAARQGLHETMDEVGRTDFRDSVGVMNTIFDAMHQKTAREAAGSGTTAFVAFMHPGYETDAGKTVVDFGAAGDSLGFIVRADGTTYALNEEETVANSIVRAQRKGEFPANYRIPESFSSTLDNGLGINSEGKRQFKGLSERHRIIVNPGDVLVLTSDGITGDADDQRLQGGNMNEDVIRDIALRKDVSPREKAELLVQAATKNDDRTALVVEIGGQTDVPQREAGQVPHGWKKAADNVGGIALVR